MLGIFLGRPRFLVGTLSSILNGPRPSPVNPDFLGRPRPLLGGVISTSGANWKVLCLGTTAYAMPPSRNGASILDASPSSPGCGCLAALRTPFPPHPGRGQVPCYPTRHSRAYGHTPSSPLVHSANVFLRTRDAPVKTFCSVKRSDQKHYSRHE